MQSKPKKIGTLTLPLHSNYGGLLQAYALQRYLKERGHEILVIDRQFNKKFTANIHGTFNPNSTIVKFN